MGSRTPLVMFSCKSATRGSYRFGPLPPGAHKLMTHLESQDAEHRRTIPAQTVVLEPGVPKARDIEALDGAVVVLEGSPPSRVELERTEFAVFEGEHELSSVAAFRTLLEAVPLGEKLHASHRGEEASDTDASFGGLVEGVYTACIVTTDSASAPWMRCRVVELAADAFEIVPLGPA